MTIHHQPIDGLSRQPVSVASTTQFLLRRSRHGIGWTVVIILCMLLCIGLLVFEHKLQIEFEPVSAAHVNKAFRISNRPPSDSLPASWESGQAADSIETSNESRFHLLIPASQPNPDLCKTIMSAMILDYPSPVLINFEMSLEEGSKNNWSHLEKIRGVNNFLAKDKIIRPRDVVLIVDGYDVWFQLPPVVMIRRMTEHTHGANLRLKRTYGSQRYSEKVVFAADKLCWPNPIEDPACQSIPSSTLPVDTWGATTDREPGDFNNRPRFLNSDTVIGRAEDVLHVYRQALWKIDEQDRGNLGDQFVMSEIFGEQEYQRKEASGLSSNQTPSSAPWILRMIRHFGAKAKVRPNTGPAILVPNSMTTIEGREYEYGIGLDYEMRMFQTMTHSHGDILHLNHNDTTGWNTLMLSSELITQLDQLSSEFGDWPEPFEPRDHQPPLSSKDSQSFSPVNISDLPLALGWEAIGLATNIHVPQIPSLLHFNGDKTYLASWWDRNWYFPHARALLRRYVLSPPPVASEQFEKQHSSDHVGRGGKGGVWTDDGRWFSWGDLCGGWEEEIFADGLGRWGKEDGRDGKRYDDWGKVISDTDLGLVP